MDKDEKYRQYVLILILLGLCYVYYNIFFLDNSEIDKQKINGTSDLRNVIFYKYPGTTINLTIIREGKLINQYVTLASRPSDEELYGNNLNDN